MRTFAPFIVRLVFVTNVLTLAMGAPTDAPPPPNPAMDAGEKWPARRAQLERKWLKLLGPFPSAKTPLDLQVLSTETVPALPDDPSYPIRAGDIARYKVKFRSEANAWCRQPATMEPWTPVGDEGPSSGAESLRRWDFLDNNGSNFTSSDEPIPR